MGRRSWPALSLFAVAGVLATFLVLWATGPYGPGVSSDSVTYLAGATNISLGRGFSAANGTPIVHFPPLYPIMLAGVDTFRGDLVDSARLLSACLFGITLFLVAAALLWATHRASAGICAITLLVSSGPLISVYSMVLSEPPFIVLALAGTFSMAAHFVSRRTSLFVVSGLACGVAASTRYIGLALIAAGAVLLVMNVTASESPLQRIRRAALWCVVSSVPFGIVALRNIFASGRPTSRTAIWHPTLPLTFTRNTLSELAGLAVTPSVPPTIDIMLMACFAAVVVMLLNAHVRERRAHAPSRATALGTCCLLFATSYLALLFVSLSLFDGGTPIDSRIMSPVFAFGVLGLIAAVHSVCTHNRPRLLWWIFVTGCVLVLPIRALTAVRTVDRIRTRGLQYTAREWHASQGVAFAKSDESPLIYSNHARGLQFWTSRAVEPTPRRILNSRQWNEHLSDEMRVLCDSLDNGALLIWFDVPAVRSMATLDDVSKGCEIRIVRQLSDATVYGAR